VPSDRSHRGRSSLRPRGSKREAHQTRRVDANLKASNQQCLLTDPDFPLGLARDAERAHCLAHPQEVLAGITVETILEVFGEVNTLRRAGCRLLAGNNAVIEQAMDSGSGDAMHDSSLLANSR
jgi:hypothetical protein